MDSGRSRFSTDAPKCPNCGHGLVEIERSDVTIDACPECRGVWLDRGELDRILEKERRITAGVTDEDEDFFREVEGRRTRPTEPQNRQGEQYDKKRRKRGLLEDLLDF